MAKGEENIQVSSIELNDNMIVASFNNNHEEKNNIKNEDNVTNTNEQFQNTTKKIKSKYKASNGKTYDVIANLNIPSLGIKYPVPNCNFSKLRVWIAKLNTSSNSRFAKPFPLYSISQDGILQTKFQMNL